MKHKFKNYIMLAVCLSFVLLICCSCNRTYIEFDDKLNNVLSTQYGIQPPASAELVSSEKKTFPESEPHLDVVFDVPADDLPGTFDERMWEKSDIDYALMRDVGADTSVDWIVDWVFTAYYYADLHIEKIDSGLFRVYFCGYARFDIDAIFEYLEN